MAEKKSFMLTIPEDLRSKLEQLGAKYGLTAHSVAKVLLAEAVEAKLETGATPKLIGA